MTKELTKGSPFRLIFSFMLPVLIGNIFQQLYNMADTLIVGHTVSSDAMAGVGSTGSITFLIIGFATGLTSGFAVRTSQRFGARDEAGRQKERRRLFGIMYSFDGVFDVLGHAPRGAASAAHADSRKIFFLCVLVSVRMLRRNRRDDSL